MQVSLSGWVGMEGDAQGNSHRILCRQGFAVLLFHFKKQTLRRFRAGGVRTVVNALSY